MQGKLEYNRQNDRYGLLVGDIFEKQGFSCGDTLEALIADEWRKTRIEMDWSSGKGEWYLVNTPYKGNLNGVEVRV